MSWRSLTTMPRSGEFMIAEYAPTNWQYRCVHIRIPPTLNEPDLEERLNQFLRMHTRYARAWRPLVPPPTKIPEA